MVVAVEDVSEVLYDITADLPVQIAIPVYEVGDIKVYYGRGGAEAVYGLDYTIELQPQEFQTFKFTPNDTLVLKANQQAIIDGDELSVVVIERELDYQTEATPGNVRNTAFTSREFDRAVMRDQQLRHKLMRTVTLPPGFDGHFTLRDIPNSVFGLDEDGNVTNYLLSDLGGGGGGSTDADKIFLNDRTSVEVALTGRPAVVLRVPSFYATVQDALVAAAPMKMRQGVFAEVMIESGFVIQGPTALAYGDFSHVRISSEDAEVKVSDTFPNGEDGFTFINCRAPMWNIMLDMNAKGRNALWLESGAHMVAVAQKGVRRAGGFGPDPKGCGLFMQKTCSITCEPINVNGKLVGFISRDNAQRGIDITHNSHGSLVGAQFINNGTTPDITFGHAHAFVSRASSVQLDNSYFEGGVRAIRAARSMVSARKCEFKGVKGSIVWQFEEGFVVVADAVITDCGHANYPHFLIEGSSSARPQGGGTITAESSTITNPIGLLAKGGALGSVINMDNCTVSGIRGRVAEITQGTELSIARSVFRINAAFVGTDLFIISDGMKLWGLGADISGGNIVPDLVRLTNGGQAHLRNALLRGAANQPVTLETVGCRALLIGATFDAGVTFPAIYSTEPGGPAGPDGPTGPRGPAGLDGDDGIDGIDGAPGPQGLAGRGISFATRAEAVSRLAEITANPDGTVFFAGGLTYEVKAGSTAIADMRGVQPFGIAYPEHDGAVGDGVADDSTTMALWAKRGGKLGMRTGAVYRMAKRIELVFPLNTYGDLTGGTVFQDYSELSNNGAMQLFGRLKGLRWKFAENCSMQRGAVLWTGSQLLDFEILSPTDFPRNDDVRDGLLIVRGPNVKVKHGRFEGIYNPIQFYADADCSDTQIQDIDFIRYGDGVSIRSNISSRLVLDDLRYHSINSNSATDPGMNTVTGGGPYMNVSGIRHVTEARGSGEHFLYSAVPDGTLGAFITRVQSRGSGQCFMKFRGHDAFRITDCHGEGASAENAIGTNEDGFRFENCRRLIAENLSMRVRTGMGSGGFDGINLNNSWEMHFSNLVLLRQSRAAIHICTPPSTTYSQSPNQAVEDINIRGLLCRVSDAGKPLILLGEDDGATTTTCKVGNITISGLDWDGEPENLVVVKPGITRQTVAGTAIRISGTIKGRPFSYVWAAASASGAFTWLTT